MCPGNIIAGVNKGKIERPPNCEYSNYLLGHGWVDRERKIAAPSGKFERKVVRSILKGGEQKMIQMENAFEAARNFEQQQQQQQEEKEHINRGETASPEQRLSGFVRQLEGGSGASGGTGEKIMGGGRVGGLRDSIDLAREKGVGVEILLAAQEEGKNLEDEAARNDATSKGQSSFARQLARVQQDSAKHALTSPTNASLDRNNLKSISQKEAERQQAAATLLQSEFILNNSDASISSGSTPTVNILPSFLYDNGSLGSLSR